MDNQTFIIKNLSIQRMPGFKQGLEIKEDLDKSIVIVAGPNASGKSSIARMIQKLIWQDETSGILAECSAKIGEDTWKIEINSDNVPVQREGIDDDFKTKIPPSEAKSRYMLALHKLINETEESLAKEIIKESIGGYDLDKAEAELDYKDNIKNRRAGEYKDFDKAKKNFGKLKRKHKALKAEEEKLDDLFKNRKNARKAQRYKDFYEKVIDYIKAKEKYNEHYRLLKDFPEEMENVTGEECEKINALENEIESAEKQIEKANDKIEENNNIISNLEIPDQGIDNKIIDELEERITNLSELEDDLANKQENITQLNTEVSQSLQNINESIDPEEWEGIDLENINELDQFLRDAHQKISEKKFLETNINKLKTEIEANEVNDSNLLNEGIRCLSYWLQENVHKITIHSKEIWCAISAIIITTAAVIFLGLPEFCGFVIFGIFLIYLIFKNKFQTNIRKKDYENTELELPEKWATREVSNKLTELIEELKQAESIEILDQRKTQYEEEFEEVQDKIYEFDERYQELADKIGAVPNLPSDNIRNYAGLYWFLDNVKTWQKSYNKLKSITANSKQKTESLEEESKKINEILTGIGFSEIDDYAAAKATFNKVKRDKEIFNEKIQDTIHQEELIENFEESKQKSNKKLKEIYEKLNLEQGDKEKVKEYTNKLDEFNEISERHAIAKSDFTNVQVEIRDYPLYEDFSEEIECLSLDEASSRLENFKNDAKKLTEIQEKITKIETKIIERKTRKELEQALSEKDNALDDLEELYENNLSSITGKLLIDQLKDVIREKNRPLVLKKADEMFNRITAGRYELRVSKKGNEPNFRAFDTTLDKGQDLEEISTGTRIQLLLSTRLAFVETQEPAIKLPILADELLADSDDQRAGEIIKALIEISKKGRQIFYFTAQADELSKWKSYLEEYSDIDYSIVKLTEKNSNSFNYDQVDYDFNSLTVYNIPTPENDTHSSYKDKIDLEKFNLLIHKPAGLHIWYLIEKVDLIYNCLKKGVKHWGQLKSYMKHNGIIEGLTEAKIKLFKEKITILEYFQKLYRQGRPIPIDRMVLDDSGAVSEAFIDEVSAKLNEKERNPKKLLKSLENREVSGFRSNKINELKDYLINNEYIDDMEPMEDDEIMIKLNTKLSNLEIDSSKAKEFLQRIINYSQERD